MEVEYIPAILQIVVLGATGLFLTFSLGYIILRAVTNLTVKECLALAGACGMALQGAVAFIGFLLGFSDRIFFILATAGILAAAIVLLLRKSPAADSVKGFSWLYLLIVFWMTLAGIQLCVLIYSGAFFYGDWWMHYDIAQVYLGKQRMDTVHFGKYIFISRTPLFNLFSGYHLALLWNQFSTYQLSSILPGIFLLAAITLLVRPGQVVLMLILLMLNPYMNCMMIYPWPKVLASLYMVCGIYFYLDLRKSLKPVFFSQSGVACGISLGLAILSHPSTVLYVAAIIADNIWLHRKSLANVLRQLLVPLVVSVGVLLPWILWSMYEYSPAEFFLAMSMTVITGAQTIATGTQTVIQKLIDTFRNAVSTLFPFLLYSALKDIIEKPDFGPLWNPLFRFYYAVLPGALTITMSFLLISGAVKRYLRKIRPLQSVLPGSLFLIVLVIGFLGGCILQPGFNLTGIVGESMTPMVILLLLVAAEYLYALPVKLRQMMLLMVAGEFLFSRGIHLFFLAINHPAILDGNADLKFENNLVFAGNLIATRWPAGIVIILFLILLVIGLKASSASARPEKMC